jgi:hypothetical protein
MLLHQTGPNEGSPIMKIRVACCTAFVAALFLGAPAWAAKVTVCHVPPGNPDNFHTISVGENAVKAHLAHGDFLGACVTCPCWEEAELQSITADNQLDPGGLSCSSGSGIAAVIQNVLGSTPGVEGGFGVFAAGGEDFVCATRDLPPFALPVTPAQMDVCVQQIRNRCEAIGTPIP